MNTGIDISIIIPYYNAGLYIQEAIDSVRMYKGEYSYEIIIINDGSTDPDSIKKIKLIEQDGLCTVLNQENRGPAAARNAGCKIARGQFLLFLDSDNKIRPNYIGVGINYMLQNSKTGVVYGNPHFLENEKDKRQFKAAAFDYKKMLGSNYIDICSVVRKSAWSSIDGFDENRLLDGLEDWDFWLRLTKKGWLFEYVDEVLYEYRVLENSLAHAHVTFPDKHLDAVKNIISKHITDLHFFYNQLLKSNQHLEMLYRYERSHSLKGFVRKILCLVGFRKSEF